ncbi:MAG: hypothetical protein K8T89_17565 [Planctomycetes bacterium]|nr:hypothetical protein [Planctomycetota bacterium]
MIRRIGLLLLSALAGCLVMYLPLSFLVKEPPFLVIVLAAVICLIPGVIVLFAAGRLSEKSPEVKIVSVLLTTAFRMSMTVGGGVLLYIISPMVKEHVSSFVSWSIVFYLVTLFVETRLLYIDTFH